MTIQRTRWRPDTCGCVVEYEWNDEEGSENPTLTPALIDACPTHPATGDLAADFETILAHNRANNVGEG